MSRIYLENMNFYAYHGCFAEESTIGTHFLVNMEFETDTLKAQKSDNIKDTVSYLDVYQEVKKEMAVSSHLLEHVAERIATCVLAKFGSIDFVKVKVAKLNPPLGGKLDSVAVVIEKTR